MERRCHTSLNRTTGRFATVRPQFDPHRGFRGRISGFSAERLIVIHNGLSPQTDDYASADSHTGTVERPGYARSL
jgi:hypothetical protein